MNINITNESKRNAVSGISTFIQRVFGKEVSECTVQNDVMTLTAAQTQWERISKEVTAVDKDQLLSDCFTYLAALRIFNTGLPVSVLKGLMGEVAAEAMCTAIQVAKGTGLRVDAGRILLVVPKLTNVELISFVEKSYDSVATCLASYVDLIREDESAVVAFEKTVMSLSTLYDNDKVKLSDLKGLLKKYEHPEYLEILQRNDRIHSFLIAKASAEVMEMDSREEEFPQRASEVFSDAFTVFLKAVPQDNQKYRNISWMQFANAAENYTDRIPKSLLDYIDEETYCSITQSVKSHMIKLKTVAPNTIREKNAVAYEVSLCERILQEINENDIPICLLMGNILVDKGEFAEARSYFQRVCNQGELAGINGATAMLTAFQKEIKFLVNKKHTSDKAEAIKCDNRIRVINLEMEKLFRRYEITLLNQITVSAEANRKLESDYISLVAKHARYEKDRGLYETAYQLLSEVPGTYKSFYRIPFEFGLLYQTRGSYHRPNPYFDSAKAIEMLKTAYSMLDEQATPYDKKSILIPLANTYFSCESFSDAKATCALIMRIDRNEPKAKALLKRIAETKAQRDAA